MSETPRASVITSTFNRPGYLAEAIASVRAQTDTEWEHLVRDNGSTDEGVAEVIEREMARDGRFLALYGKSVSPARAWNEMIDRSRGRYVGVLDDDNRWRPEHLEKMVAPMEADDAVDAVTCSWDYIDAEGKPAQGRPTCRRNLETSLRELYRDNTVDSSALLIRRTAFDRVGGFPEDISTNEDWVFVIRLVSDCESRGRKIVHLPDVLLEYREHDAQRSKSSDAVRDYSVNWPRIRREMFPGGRP